MAVTATGPATGPGTPAPVADATGISKRFGATVALRDARITVAPGEAHALVGRNGAGAPEKRRVPESGCWRPHPALLRRAGARPRRHRRLALACGLRLSALHRHR
jgi:simple sugar transport system ATP-binding protein